MLALLDALKPVYERQPAYVAAMKGWTQNRANQLRSVGRPDEALALQKQLAADYPHDVSLQIEYASALFNAGEYDAAYAWLDQGDDRRRPLARRTKTSGSARRTSASSNRKAAGRTRPIIWPVGSSGIRKPRPRTSAIWARCCGSIGSTK